MNRILLFLLLFLPSIAFAQLYGTGVGYVNGTPAHTPNTAQKGSELCVSINNHMLYLWNRDSAEWKPLGGISVSFGAPIAAPASSSGTRTAINMQTGLIYWWNGTAWKEVISYSVELASAYAASVAELYANQVRSELTDSMVVARAYADSLHLADNDRDSTNELQNLVLLGTVLNITDGNAVDFAGLYANYLLKADTATLVATKYYTRTNPTTIVANAVPRSTGTNLVAGDITDNGSRVVMGLPMQLKEYSLVGLPTGTTKDMYWITGAGPAWYQGARVAYALESEASRFTTGSLIFAGANGQAAQNNSKFFVDNTNIRFAVGTNNPTKLFTLFGQTGSQGFYIDKSPVDPNFWRLEKVTGGNGFIDFTNSNINISNRLSLPITGFAKIWNAQSAENYPIGDFFYSNNYRLYIHPGAGNSNTPFGGTDGADLYVMGGDSNNSDADITGGDVYIQGGRALSRPISSSGNVIFNWKDWGLVGIRTRTPTRVFDVNGVSRFRDTVLINNGLVKTNQAPIIGKNVNWAETGSIMFGEDIRTNNTGFGAGPNVLVGLRLMRNAPAVGGGRFILFGDQILDGATTAYNAVGIGIQVADQSTTAGNDFFVGGTVVARYATNLNRAIILANRSFNRTAGVDLNQTVALGYGHGSISTSKSAGGTHMGYEQIPMLVSGDLISTYGYRAGQVIKRGTNLSFIGNFTGATDTMFSDASAIGNYAAIGQNQSITIGAINGVNGATYDAKIGLGTVTPRRKMELVGDMIVSDTIFNTSPATHSTQDGLVVWKSTAQGYALGKSTIDGKGLGYDAGQLSVTHNSATYVEDAYFDISTSNSIDEYSSFSIWARQTSSFTDSMFIDLPSPTAALYMNEIEVYGESDSADLDDQIYIRGSIWMNHAPAGPEIIYKLTSISSNGYVAKFKKMERDGVWYWVLVKEKP